MKSVAVVALVVLSTVSYSQDRSDPLYWRNYGWIESVITSNLAQPYYLPFTVEVNSRCNIEQWQIAGVVWSALEEYNVTGDRIDRLTLNEIGLQIKVFCLGAHFHTSVLFVIDYTATEEGAIGTIALNEDFGKRTAPHEGSVSTVLSSLSISVGALAGIVRNASGQIGNTP